MIFFHKKVRAILSLLFFTVNRTTYTNASALFNTTVREMQSNIIGGGNVNKDKYPWFAKALKGDGSWQECGGSLVSPEYVLTAAECVINTPDLAKFQIGALSDDDTNGGQISQTIQVENIYRHKDYNPFTNDKDFALIKLAQRVNRITPVKMDPGTLSPSYSGGKYCTFGIMNH